MFSSRQKLGQYHLFFNRAHKETAAGFWLRFLRRFLALIVVGGIVYFLLFSTFFQVQNIEVDGANMVSRQSIINLLPKRENILFYPVSKTQNEIKKHFSEIESVRITRGLPRSIRVEIVEFQPELVWQRNNSLGLVNSQGQFISRIASSAKINQPKVIELIPGEIQLGDQVATKQFVSFIRQLAVELGEIPSINIDHFELSASSFDCIVKTRENIDIWVDSDQDLSRQVFYIREILAKRRDKVTKKIDVRIPHWGYVE